MDQKNGHSRISQQKRADIVAAAAAEFQRKGFDGTSMNGIADAAGVSKRTIYKHFESKDALFLAIVDQLITRSMSLPDLDFEVGQDMEQVLTDHANAVIDLLNAESFQALARVALSRFLSDPTVAQQTIGDHRRFQQKLTDWVKAGMKAGCLKKEDPVWVTSVFTGLLKEFVFWPQVISGEPPLSAAKRRKLIRWVVGIFLDRFATV